MAKIISLALLLTLVGAPVFAQQQNCGPRDVVSERLQALYSEVVHARGISQDGQVVVEVWGSPESGSWTITGTTPAGLTCLIGSGRSFETITPKEAVKGDKI